MPSVVVSCNVVVVQVVAGVLVRVPVRHHQRRQVVVASRKQLGIKVFVVAANDYTGDNDDGCNSFSSNIDPNIVVDADVLFMCMKSNNEKTATTKR